MKRLMTLFCITLGLALSPVSIDAQPERQQNIPPRAEASHSDIDLIPNPAGLTPPAALAPKSVKREDRVVKKGILAPAESDVNAHLFLLSLDKTGIMRLLPRETVGFKLKGTMRVGVRGTGAFFSFFNRSHDDRYDTDISYERGYLIAGGFPGPNYGFLTDLGDTPLEPIVATDPRVSTSLNYKPPRLEYEARIEQRTFRIGLSKHVSPGGVTIDGVLYQRNLPPKVNHTYLLRAITYDKSDLLVAFRVIRINDDGGLTIAWKILKEFQPPKLLRVVNVNDL